MVHHGNVYMTQEDAQLIKNNSYVLLCAFPNHQHLHCARTKVRSGMIVTNERCTLLERIPTFPISQLFD